MEIFAISWFIMCSEYEVLVLIVAACYVLLIYHDAEVFEDTGIPVDLDVMRLRLIRLVWLILESS